MASVQADAPGAMAAVKGLSAMRLQELCTQARFAGRVWPANFNAPGQTVASGERRGVEQLVELAAAAGAEETLILNVGVAAHTQLMQPVQNRLAELIESLRWREPEIPMVANVSGSILEKASTIRQALIDQITRPVEWLACVRTLAAAGCTTFLELGPGRVLSGLVSQTLEGAEVYASASPRRIKAFAESLHQMALEQPDP
jgi:[acyl-carrier-protein] S-malonyltransferase